MSNARNGLAERVAHLVEQADFLDPLADALARILSPLRRLGVVTDLLAGTPLGHPAHPAVVLLPLGSWTSATVLDVLGDESTRSAATMLTGAGVVLTAPAALTGAHDWLDTEGPQRRVGLVHALANTSAVACFAAGWLARRKGEHDRGVRLGLAGSGLMGFSAWLGGHLTYTRGVGVRADAPGLHRAPAPGAPGGPMAAADVVDLLMQQHREAIALMARVEGSAGEQRARAFLELRRMLAVHEAAEQAIVHPATRQGVPGGEALVKARLDEEARAVSAMTELEQFDIDSPDFAGRFATLQQDVRQHAEHEETEELTRLRREHTREDLVVLAEEVRRAQQAASLRLAQDNVSSFPAMVEVARSAVASAR